MHQQLRDALRAFPSEAPFRARQFAEPITNLALAVAQQLDCDNGAALALTVAGLQSLYAALEYFCEADNLLYVEPTPHPEVVEAIEARIEAREEYV